jgi:hypothetical protein
MGLVVHVFYPKITAIRQLSYGIRFQSWRDNSNNNLILKLQRTMEINRQIKDICKIKWTRITSLESPLT